MKEYTVFQSLMATIILLSLIAIAVCLLWIIWSPFTTMWARIMGTSLWAFVVSGVILSIDRKM